MIDCTQLSYGEMAEVVRAISAEVTRRNPLFCNTYTGQIDIGVFCLDELQRMKLVGRDGDEHEPTAEQLAAIRAFAAANGRTWKSALRFAWETGRYKDYNGTDRVDLLQQIRNSFGPSWLIRFRLGNRA